MDIIENKDPIDLFSLVFTDEVFEKISKNSNLYYHQSIQNKTISETSDYLSRWKDITKNECKAFLGVSILMGLNYRNNLDDHWSPNEYMKSIVSENYS